MEPENESLLPTSGLLKRLQGPQLPILPETEAEERERRSEQLGMSTRQETQTGAESQSQQRDLAYSLNSLSAGAETQAARLQKESKSNSGGVPSSAEIRDNLIDRRWVPQMSGQEDTSSGDQGQAEGDLSLGDVIHAPHSTLRSPARNLALPPPPPLRMPSPPPAVNRKRESDEQPKRTRKRLKKESEVARWNSDDEEEDSEEEDDESPPIQGPPSSQPRGAIPPTQDSQVESTGVSATQDVNPASDESEDEGNSRSVDMDIDESVGPDATRRSTVPHIASLGLPRSRALSRASEEDDEEEPTQITDPSYASSRSDPAQQARPAARILAKSTPAVPDSDEAKRLTEPSSALSDLQTSPPKLKATLLPSEHEEPLAQSGATDYDGIPETQPPAPKPPAPRSRTTAAVVIPAAPRRSETHAPVAGPSRLPPPGSTEAARTKRKISTPSHLVDYYQESDSDPEVMPKPKNRRSLPKESDSEGEAPAVNKDVAEQSRHTRVIADDSDSEPEIIRPSKNRRAAPAPVPEPAKEVKVVTKKVKGSKTAAKPPPTVAKERKGKAKVAELPKIEIPVATRAPSVAASTTSELVENYVLALYRNGATQCFYPSKVIGVTADGLKVKTADGYFFSVHYGDIRKCLIKEGDLVEFWGADTEGERLPVVRVEDHATTENLEEHQVPSPEDIVVCCKAGKNPVYQRWAVAAICYPADTKAQMDRLNDRKLDDWDIAAYQGHGTSRRRVVPTKTISAYATSGRISPALSINVPRGLFAGLGILITEPPGSSAPVSPKRKASGSSANLAPLPDRSTIVKKLEQGGAHIFDEVAHLFKEDDESQGVFIHSSAIRNLEHIYLIAPQPCTTPKYLAALALGVPCLSQRWIAQCAEAGELVDWRPHLLSAATHVGLGVQARILGDQSFSVADLERRRRDAALLTHEPVLCLAVNQVSAESFNRSLRPLLLAMGASSVNVSAQPARSISASEAARYGLIIYEDGRSDATSLQGARVMGVHELKESVYTGRM